VDLSVEQFWERQPEDSGRSGGEQSATTQEKRVRTSGLWHRVRPERKRGGGGRERSRRGIPEDCLTIVAPRIKHVKSREPPNADVEIGHRSISVCHLVNITRELNRKLTWDPVAERFINDDEANKLVTRPRRAGFELPEA